MTVCYKMGNVQITADNPNGPSYIAGEVPPAHTRPPPPPPERPPRPGAQPVYPPLAGDTAAANDQSIVRQKNFWSDKDEDVLKAIKEGYIATHYAMWKEQGRCI